MSFALASLLVVVAYGGGRPETAQSGLPVADVFGIVGSAENTDRLIPQVPNRIELIDGTVVSWTADDDVEVSGCDQSYAQDRSIVGCPVYVWFHDDGSAQRVLGASLLNPATEGSADVWSIPGGLYRRTGEIGTMSTGSFRLGPDVSERTLNTTCRSVPQWEIDPKDGTVLRFLGWGPALFRSPCDWNV